MFCGKISVFMVNRICLWLMSNRINKKRNKQNFLVFDCLVNTCKLPFVEKHTSMLLIACMSLHGMKRQTKSSLVFVTIPTFMDTITNWW